MASEIKVDTIVNAGGDNDTGIDLATNDQILLKVANATRLTMNSTGQTTIVGEGGTTTTSVQQGLLKNWVNFDQRSTPAARDSFNTASFTDQDTGKVYVNFTNNMANDKFSVTTQGGRDVDYIIGCRVNEHSTSTYRITSTNNPYGGASQSYVDTDSAFSHCSGDLA